RLDSGPRPAGAVGPGLGDPPESFWAIANAPPYPIRLACLLEAPETAVVEDLGRGLRLAPTAESGGRNLVLDLLPFGVSAIRIGSARARVASLTAYPTEAVLTGMEARSRELSLQLARLNHGLSAVGTEPANPRFEPTPAPVRAPAPAPPTSTGSRPAGEELPPLPGASDPGVTTAGRMGPGASDPSRIPGGWRLEAGEPGAGASGARGANAQ